FVSYRPHIVEDDLVLIDGPIALVAVAGMERGLLAAHHVFHRGPHIVHYPRSPDRHCRKASTAAGNSSSNKCDPPGTTASSALGSTFCQSRAYPSGTMRSASPHSSNVV